MAWETDGSSKRRQELPPDWEWRRQATRERAGGRCEYRFPNGGRCRDQGTDADHAFSRDDHDHLMWLCRYHHNQKTARESAAARRAIAVKAKHPAERHPGLA